MAENSRISEPFTPAHFVDLLQKEQKWFALLDTLRYLRWQRTIPEECPEAQAVVIMLRERARLLRN